jgi:hypothetical protein
MSHQTHFSKYIIYVDESGDHGLTSIDSTYPIFNLAFCIFDKKYFSESVIPVIQKIKFDHFGHDQVVLHEHEIRKEKGAFRFKNKDEKKRFLERIHVEMTELKFIIISTVILKNKFKPKDETLHPYHYALQHCLSKLDQFLTEKGEHSKVTHIIFECRGNAEDRELELEFRRLCDAYNYNFEIIFADKKSNSVGLQIADLVARPIGIKALRPEQANRAFDVIKDLFFCEGGRKNSGSHYEGFGFNILP